MRSFLLVFFLFGPALFADFFSVPGYEFEKRIELDVTPLLSSKIPWLQSSAPGGTVRLFWRSGDLVTTGSFHPGGRLDGVRALFKQDPLVEPSLSENEFGHFILGFHQGLYTIYELAGNGDAVPRASHSNENGFHFHFWVAAEDFFLAVPVFEEDRYVIEVVRLPRNGSPSSKVIRTTRGEKEVKGLFFPRFAKSGSGELHFFHVVREYSKSKNILIDSIHQNSRAELSQLTSEPGRKIPASGFINTPPDYLEWDNKGFLLYSSKEKAVYDVKVLSLTDRIEYGLGWKFAHSHSVRYFQENNLLDVFFLTTLGEEGSLYRRIFDLGRLSDPKYVLEGKPAHAAKARVRALSVTEIKNNRYIFMLSDQPKGLFFSEKDRSANPPDLALLARRDGERYYPEFLIEESADPAGIAGHGFVIDQNPGTVPGIINLQPDDRMISTKSLALGNYYLHILSVDRLGNISAVRHLPVVVGNNAVSVLAAAPVKKKNPEHSPGPPGKHAKPPDTTSVRKETSQTTTGEPTAEFENRRYFAYLAYLRDAEKSMGQHSFQLARLKLDQASLLYPDRMETYFQLSLIEKQERARFLLFKIGFLLFGLFVIFFIIFSIRLFYR